MIFYVVVSRISCLKKNWNNYEKKNLFTIGTWKKFLLNTERKLFLVIYWNKWFLMIRLKSIRVFCKRNNLLKCCRTCDEVDETKAASQITKAADLDLIFSCNCRRNWINGTIGKLYKFWYLFYMFEKHVPTGAIII